MTLKIVPGRPDALGATPDARGTNFAVAVGQNQLRLHPVGVEQAEPHLITARGHREVRAPEVGRGAERIRLPGHDFQCHRSFLTTRFLTPVFGRLRMRSERRDGGGGSHRR